ncbi:hypothetical protein Tco_0429352 [Tanacetum coccineum]
MFNFFNNYNQNGQDFVMDCQSRERHIEHCLISQAVDVLKQFQYEVIDIRSEMIQKSRGYGYAKRHLQLLAKYFKKLYKPTNNNLQASSKLQEHSLKIPTTSGASGSASKTGYSALSARILDTMPGKCRKPSG